MYKDIVYVYGFGYSAWRENEIKYSLRSLARFGQNYNRVFIVGDCPIFVNQSVIHIPFKEDKFRNKKRNIIDKIIAACKEADITDDFILFNDDYFIAKPLDFNNLPYFYDKTLEEKISEKQYDDYYKQSIINTYKALKKNNKPHLHYDIHYPIFINKVKFLEVMDKYDYNIRDGYAVKSLYCNELEVEGVKKDECKINGITDKFEIENIFERNEIISTGEMTREIINKIISFYPEKEKFEKKVF